MSVVTKVSISRFAEKQLERLPDHIAEALEYWKASVEISGIREVRKLFGYHDEPLYGDRQGQRSIRLNRAYRLFYIETIVGIEIIVIEVNKHEY